MLTRQKLILALLHYKNTPSNHTNLVKLSFLLRKETAVKKDPTFYDFVPYKYGPFSFALYRELDSLNKNGYFESMEDGIAISHSSTDEVQKKVEELPLFIREAVFSIVQRYEGIPHDSLLKDIYARYPWYAAKSERKDLSVNSKSISYAAPAVYTLGYQNKSADTFFKKILKTGIKSILDIRENPLSRKYGFSKKSLMGIAGKLEIDYQHFPELGIPGDQRIDLSSDESYQKLFLYYENKVLASQKERISFLANIMKEIPSVLVCMEEDPNYCHRSKLAAAISELSGLQIKHLQ